MEQKVVAHLRDGQIHKGITRDFEPRHEHFHVLPAEGGGVPVRLSVGLLKALFFVRDFAGNAEFEARRQWLRGARRGHRYLVTFDDGEVIWGTSDDFDEGSPGFFLEPSDPDDNNLRIFVVNRSVQRVERIDE